MKLPSRSTITTFVPRIFKTNASVAFLDASCDGWWEWDLEKDQCFVSKPFKRLCGYTAEEFSNKTIVWKHMILEEDFRALQQTIVENTASAAFRLSMRYYHKNGNILWTICHGIIHRNKHGKITRVLATHTNVSSLKHTEEKLAQLANYDSLTKLPNRRFFQNQVERAIQRAKRNNGHLALLFLDLDNFKPVNDQYGHETGDRLLQGAARILASVLRDIDSIARLAGDEFAMIVENVASPLEVALVAKRILQAFNTDIEIDGKKLRTTASIGITFYPVGGTDFKTLLDRADVAMYRAKSKGRCCYEFYTEELNQRQSDSHVH